MHCTFNFRPVGQGGFSTGSIKDNNCPVFDFVYDCGSLTPGVYLSDQITEARNGFRTHRNKRTIDLLIISHFDEDHVNGMIELLRDVHCRVLVIPFMTVVERLTVFAKKGAKSQWHQRLLANPQIFFSGDEFNIDRVIMVDGNEEPRNDNVSGNIPFDVEILGSNSPAGTTRLIAGGFSFNNQFVYMQIPFALEEKKFGFNFKFYVKRMPEVAVTSFQNALALAFPNVTTAELFEDKHRLIIKGLYQAIFRNINKTSLCVSIRKKQRSWVRYDDDPNLLFDYKPRVVGILLTGDTFLKSNSDRREFLNYYSDDIDDTLLFQIPHHGSKYNSKIERHNPLWNFNLFVMQYGAGRSKHPSVKLNSFVIHHHLHVQRITENSGFKLGYEII